MNKIIETAESQYLVIGRDKCTGTYLGVTGFIAGTGKINEFLLCCRVRCADDPESEITSVMFDNIPEWSGLKEKWQKTDNKRASFVFYTPVRVQGKYTEADQYNYDRLMGILEEVLRPIQMDDHKKELEAHFIEQMLGEMKGVGITEAPLGEIFAHVHAGWIKDLKQMQEAVQHNFGREEEKEDTTGVEYDNIIMFPRSPTT